MGTRLGATASAATHGANPKTVRILPGGSITVPARITARPTSMKFFVARAKILAAWCPATAALSNWSASAFWPFRPLWLLSGFYFIQPNEHGVVLTFGKYTKTEEMPGLKYRFPRPIQSTTIVPVTAERRIQVGFHDNMSQIRTQTSQNVSDESLMLTGDENIVDIDFVVLWRIGSAKDYLFSIRDTENTQSSSWRKALCVKLSAARKSSRP